MDRKSITGLVLIGVVILGYMMWVGTSKGPAPEKDKAKKDSFYNDNADKKENKSFSAPAPHQGEEKFGKAFSAHSQGDKNTVTVETDLVKVLLSSKGGGITKWELKKYKKWDKTPSQLISEAKGQLFMNFITFEGKRIDSRDLYFSFGDTPAKVRLSGNKQQTISAILEVEPGKFIKRTYRFHGNKYIVDTGIELVNMEKVIPQRGYNLVWAHGISYQEKNSVDESNEATAMTVMNGEVQDLAADEDFKKESSQTGKIDYIATKTKYFGVAIKPHEFEGTSDLSGTRQYFPATEGQKRYYDISLRVPYRGGLQSDKYMVYIGPLEYDRLNEYGLTKMVSLGWFFIRWIGEYFMMPIFKAVHYFIPNWGVTIIVFTIIMKLLLYPLSITQMKQSQKMKVLQPIMEKEREKYKDDPAEQQKAMMRIYGEYGVNPASGCLPLLLQMPILFALFNVLRNYIDLRQSDFILWINDLSMPDTLFTFGPILGIKSVSGLALLMAITMFVQQKMTISDPRQKALVYMMPVMFLFLFSSFPAGLNLYYFMFNLLSIAQQYYINNFSKKKVTLDDLRRMPKKESWLQKKMREAEEIAKAQGRPVPSFGKNQPQSGGNSRKPAGGNNNNRKKKK